MSILKLYFEITIFNKIWIKFLVTKKNEKLFGRNKNYINKMVTLLKKTKKNYCLIDVYFRKECL